MAQAPILRLEETKPDRPTIDIFGDLYELRMGVEFSPDEFAEIDRIHRAVEKIDETADNPKNFKLLIRYLDRIITMAVSDVRPMTPEVLEKLDLDQKMQVVAAFTEHCLAGDASQTTGNREQRRTAAKKTTKKSTGR